MKNLKGSLSKWSLPTDTNLESILKLQILLMDNSFCGSHKIHYMVEYINAKRIQKECK